MAPPIDRAGLLERIPELARLADEPSIQRALARGNPHHVYRALFWGRLFGQFRAQQELVASLLRERRLFLIPIKSAPLLTTLNGFGATVYGASDRNPEDGSYIKSHFFVAAFVPLVPLSQYLVVDAPDGSRGWSFIGKVPLGPVLHVWRRLVSLAAVAAVAWAALSAFHASRHGTLHVVNGLAVPVRVSVGKQSVEVAPEARAKLELDVGTQTLAVHTQAGRKVEEHALDVQSGVKALIWNVAGASPLYRERVIYRERATNDDGPEPEVACGKSKVVYDDADHLFEDPPKSVRLRNASDVETRTHVDVAPGGARSCAVWLYGKERKKDAVALAKRVAEIEGYVDASTRMAADLVAESEGPAAALDWLKPILAGNERNVELHRLYQDLARSMGKRAELVGEYRARLDRQPGDLHASYLLARLLPGGEARPLLNAALEKDPRHVPSLRALAFIDLQDLKFKDSLESWRKLESIDRVEAQQHLVTYAATSYAALGEPRQALSLLERAFAGTSDLGERNQLATFYARVAQQKDSSDPLTLARRLDKNENRPAQLLWTRVRAGADVPEKELAVEEDPADRVLLDVMWLAAKDPERALVRARDLQAKGVHNLDPETWALLYAEARRREQAETAQALAEAGPIPSGLVPSVDSFLDQGTLDAELEELPLGLRAALWFVRSRKSGLSDDERTRLRSHATACAVVPGIISRAIAGWPP